MFVPGLAEITLAAAGGCAVGTAATWLTAKWKLKRVMAGFSRAAAKLNKGLASAAERQAGLMVQVTALRSELEQRKAQGAGSQSLTGGKRATDFPEIKAMNDPFITGTARRAPLGFEDTQVLRGDAD